MTNTTEQKNWTDKEYREVCMFDCTIEEMDAMLAALTVGAFSRTVVTWRVQSMLSDVQEMMQIGESAETIRRTINRAKYMLDYLDQR